MVKKLLTFLPFDYVVESLDYLSQKITQSSVWNKGI